MTRAVLSLGSNMGDSAALLAGAVAGFDGSVRAVSSVYRTPPWGPVSQDDFLNMVILVEDPQVDAYGWLQRCHEAERVAHRVRLVQWGPRTLDVDVVAVWADDGSPILSGDTALTLPHPRAAERGFVLVPWLEFDPDAVLPGSGPIAELVKELDTSDIVRVGPLAPGAIDLGPA